MKKGGYVEGSGNVYADLGVANPQEARAKADLAHRIVDIIEGRKLTQGAGREGVRLGPTQSLRLEAGATH
jgi:Helix-turn-helix domain